MSFAIRLTHVGHMSDAENKMSNLASVIFLDKTTDAKVRRLRHKCRESIISDPIKVELLRTYVRIMLELRN